MNNAPVLLDEAGNKMKIVRQIHSETGRIVLYYESNLNKGTVLVHLDGTHDEYIYDLSNKLVSFKGGEPND